MDRKSDNILEYRHVDIHYGKKRVIEDVSLEMKPGEILGIVGESGSGKSTLLRAAMGLLGEGGEVTQGQILFQGANATIDMVQVHGEEMRRLRGAKIGMIFQNTGAALCPIRTIEEQLYEAVLEHESISKGEIRDRALELFEQLRFTNGAQLLKSYPFEFSGGMNQRVGIVLAMVLRPRLLLADEPTSALDVTTQAQIVRQMMELRDDYGTGIIIVTHNIGVAAYMADQLIVMHHGKVVDHGTREEVLNNPTSDYTRKLLEAVPEMEGKRYV